MSKYGNYPQAEFKDRECLVKALNDMGYTTVEQHEVAQHLIGYHGDRRAETAEIIVRRRYISSAANDLGFKRQANGSYTAIISEFDRGKHNDKWVTDMRVKYQTHFAAKAAQQVGATLAGEPVRVGNKLRIMYTIG